MKLTTFNVMLPKYIVYISCITLQVSFFPFSFEIGALRPLGKGTKNCFVQVRSEQNIIGSFRGRDHKIHYSQKITGHYGVGMLKTLPRRTLDSICSMVFKTCKQHHLTYFFGDLRK